MKVDELIGSLQTFEMGLCENAEKKNKSVAFVSNAEEESEAGYTEGDESISEALAMLGRQFNKLIKKFDQQGRPNVRTSRLTSGKDQLLKKSSTKARESSVMVVKGMDTSELNALLTSNCKIRG